jgi:hypothetical protein
MANTKNYLLLDPRNCLPAKDIPKLLGRICDDANEPSKNYFPEDPQEFYSKSAQPFHIEATTPAILVDSASDTLGRTLVGNVLTAERLKARSARADWHGEKVRIFTLPQEKQVLGQILEAADHRSTAEEWLDENESLYMVTGFITMINATFSNAKSGVNSVEAEASASKALEAAIVALGGAPVQLPNLGAQWKSSKEASSSWEATYVAEAVIAIKYRQLSKKWKLLSWLKSEEIEIKLSKRLNTRGGMMFGADDEGK